MESDENLSGGYCWHGNLRMHLTLRPFFFSGKTTLGCQSKCEARSITRATLFFSLQTATPHIIASHHSPKRQAKWPWPDDGPVHSYSNSDIVKRILDHVYNQNVPFSHFAKCIIITYVVITIAMTWARSIISKMLIPLAPTPT